MEHITEDRVIDLGIMSEAEQSMDSAPFDDIDLMISTIDQLLDLQKDIRVTGILPETKAMLSRVPQITDLLESGDVVTATEGLSDWISSFFGKIKLALKDANDRKVALFLSKRNMITEFKNYLSFYDDVFKKGDIQISKRIFSQYKVVTFTHKEYTKRLKVYGELEKLLVKMGETGLNPVETYLRKIDVTFKPKKDKLVIGSKATRRSMMNTIKAGWSVELVAQEIAACIKFMAKFDDQLDKIEDAITNYGERVYELVEALEGMDEASAYKRTGEMKDAILDLKRMNSTMTHYWHAISLTYYCNINMTKALYEA